METGQFAGLQAHPEGTLAILVEGKYTIASKAFRVGDVEHGEPVAVEATEPAESGQPQIAVARLENIVYHILRQAFFRGPDPMHVLPGDVVRVGRGEERALGMSRLKKADDQESCNRAEELGNAL